MERRGKLDLDMHGEGDSHEIRVTRRSDRIRVYLYGILAAAVHSGLLAILVSGFQLHDDEYCSFLVTFNELNDFILAKFTNLWMSELNRVLPTVQGSSNANSAQRRRITVMIAYAGYSASMM